MSADRALLTEVESKFTFLFQGGPPSAGPTRTSRAVETLAIFTNAVALAALSHECVVDEDFAAVFRGFLAKPTLRNALYLQERLLQERTVGAEAVLGIVPESPSREQVLLTEYIRALVTLRRALEKGGGRQSDDVLEDAAADYFTFLLMNFRGELVYHREPKEEGRQRVTPAPKERAAGGLCLRSARGKLFPLSPLVQLDQDAELLHFRSCGTAEGLTFATARPGEVVTSEGREVLTFFSDFLLRVGAYQQARAVLKRLDAQGKTERNRQSALYANYCSYGTHHLKQQEHALSLAEFDKAHKIRSDIPLLYFDLAQVHGKVKEYDRAIEFMRRLLVKHPESDKAYEVMGDLYHDKGERGLALKMYEKASVLNPLNRVAEKKRARLIAEIKKGMEKVAAGGSVETAGKKPSSKMEEFLTDMTLEAELNLYHPAIGREAEREELMEILSCRNKNNALVVGDTGVGKTVLIEDFVLRIVRGKVPGPFQGKKIYLMSVATLLAGAKYRGQFEERILDLVKELKEADCILFIDNIHNIISSGLTKGGSMDAANILKPSLLKGEIQVIGTTTWDEYRNNFEKDATLSRAFQVLKLEEPSVGETVEIVRSIKKRYEEFHGVALPIETVEATVGTIKTCLKEGSFPDKALEIYDRACAMVSLSRQEEALRRVEKEDVLRTLSSVSGIPLERISESEREKLSHMELQLQERVVGQDPALRSVSQVLRAAKLNLTLNRRRPKGVFLFVGPTGVGKTELAKALAEYLFGDEERLIRIDMSEYMERISSSRLIGTAPGYVGYNDPNQLTDEVRKNPYSLVLLDEVEKADAQMINIFLQVFDAGRLTDGKGRTVHFDNATIIMTSNVGTHLFSRPRVGYGGESGRKGVGSSELLAEVKKHFSPEFLNRIDEIVFFEPLSHEHIRRIARMQFRELLEQLEKEGKSLSLTDEAVEVLVERGYSFEHGARNLGRVIRRLILEPLSRVALGPEWDEARQVLVDARDGKIVLSLDDSPLPADAFEEELEEAEPADPLDE